MKLNVGPRSLGIKGTYQNANCHAKRLIPLIQKLEAKSKDWGFESTTQFNNSHYFYTSDGRGYILYPYSRSDGNGYIGIQLFLKESNRRKHLFLTLYTDERDGVTVDFFDTLMKSLAKPQVPHEPSDSKEEVAVATS